MAVANNADDYAATRQNIWFTAHNQTSNDGNLTGQCVTLLKWFFAQMTSIPAPFAARGNAKDVGRNLVAQGHAVEVPWSQRRRGDIICYEYGTYGHIASQLSGGRVFESNVNWSGVATKIVDGSRVYASRIGSENEAWRVGKNAHVYRLKTYSEGSDEEMITKDDIGILRIAHSEIGGWPVAETHAGKFDQIFLNAWVGKPVKDMIWAQWKDGEANRNAKYAAVEELNRLRAGQRVTKEENDSLAAAAEQLRESIRRSYE